MNSLEGGGVKERKYSIWLVYQGTNNILCATLGKLEINVTKVPPPMKASKLCNLDMLKVKENLSSLIQNCAMRGWWAIEGYDDKGKIVQKVSLVQSFRICLRI